MARTMIKRFLRRPLAMAVRFVVTRPGLKARVRAAVARWPLLTRLMYQLMGHPELQHKRRPLGPMTPRSKRIYRDLKKAKQARPD